MSKEMKDYKLLLQLFAEDGDEDEPNEPNEPNQSDNEPGTEPKAKYTDEDLDRIISSKFAKWQAKKDKEIDEAKKLAEMNAQQQAEYERDQLKQELDEYKAKDAKAQMTSEARKMLSEKNVNIGDELLSILVTNDADTTKKAIENFTTLYTKAVEKGVKDALKGAVPKGGGGKSTTITKDDIYAIKDPVERQRMIAANIELFR